MGTIHTVVWLEQMETTDLEKVERTDLEKLGEEISNHPVFAEKTNVNFVQILNRKTLKLITYERGAGMTFACGTGACASVVIGAAEGRCDKEALVLLPYGQLRIEQKMDDTVMMTGPAVRVAQGCYEE
jgi:diaminopimelate epimerase